MAIGRLIGALGIYMAGRLIRGLLVGVSPLDSLTLLAASLGLCIVTMTTCYVPARRARWGSIPRGSCGRSDECRMEELN